jgi:SHS2 domain-containing protein
MHEIATTADGLQTGGGASWEHFSHIADVGVRGFGATPDIAFEQAAKAMIAAVTDSETIESKSTIEITCQAPNMELLLVDWLNAIVYEMATRKMLFGSFSVKINGDRLSGRISGERVDVGRHGPATEVKGATLSELEVKQDPDGRWRAQCIVDV